MQALRDPGALDTWRAFTAVFDTMSPAGRAAVVEALTCAALARVVPVARATGDHVAVRLCRAALARDAGPADVKAGARLLDALLVGGAR